MMNKIKIGNGKIFLKDKSVNYIKCDKKEELTIVIDENVNTKLVIVSENDYNISIVLRKNGKLVVNSLNKDNNVNVNISLYNGSNITYNHSVIGNNDSINTFYIDHIEDDSISIINNCGINRKNNKLFFQIDGIVEKKLKNITCMQNSTIINLEKGNSKIIPNLIIDSNDIIASHSSYVGEIDENIKFYLETRGIRELEIKRMIYKAVILGKMDLSLEKEEFNNIINEWW